MTQAMADSIEQQDLFSQSDRDITSFKATSNIDLGESDEDQEHTAHLATQDRMDIRSRFGLRCAGMRCILDRR
jgi:hypothetical protein